MHENIDRHAALDEALSGQHLLVDIFRIGTLHLDFGAHATQNPGTVSLDLQAWTAALLHPQRVLYHNGISDEVMEALDPALRVAIESGQSEEEGLRAWSRDKFLFVHRPEGWITSLWRHIQLNRMTPLTKGDQRMSLATTIELFTRLSYPWRTLAGTALSRVHRKLSVGSPWPESTIARIIEIKKRQRDREAGGRSTSV